MAKWDQAPLVAPAPSIGQGASGAAPKPAWQSAPVVGGGAAQSAEPGGMSFLRDQVQKFNGSGEYAAPPPEYRTEGNPENSPLPSILGQASNTFRSFGHGAEDMSTLGLGDELYAGVSAPIRAGIDAFQGKGFDLGRSFNEALNAGETRATNLRDLNPGAYDAGGVAGSLALLGKAGSGGPVAATTKGLIKRAAAQSGGMGAAIGLGQPGSIGERLTGAAEGGVTGAVVGGAGGALIGQMARGPANSAVPTTEKLFQQGDAAFKAARASGATVAQPAATKLVAGMRQTLVDEGAITPSGKIASLPKIEHALNLADDYATNPVTIEQMLRIRKQLAKAAGSNDRDERALATQLIRQFDDDVGKLQPNDFVSGAGDVAVKNWQTGRELWHTAKKAETVDELVNSARRQTKKAAATPMEQSTRNKFGNFVDKDKNLRGFKPKEIEALRAVSEGTPFSNAAKQVGRLAPTTMGSLTYKAAVPFAMGAAASGGNPLVGGAVAGATLGAGYVGKAIAALSTSNKAKLAQLLIRNGGTLPGKVVSQLPKELQQVAKALTTTGGANAGQAGLTLADALKGYLPNQRAAQ